MTKSEKVIFRGEVPSNLLLLSESICWKGNGRNCLNVSGFCGPPENKYRAHLQSGRPKNRLLEFWGGW